VLKARRVDGLEFGPAAQVNGVLMAPRIHAKHCCHAHALHRAARSRRAQQNLFNSFKVLDVPDRRHRRTFLPAWPWPMTSHSPGAARRLKRERKRFAVARVRKAATLAIKAGEPPFTKHGSEHLERIPSLQACTADAHVGARTITRPCKMPPGSVAARLGWELHFVPDWNGNCTNCCDLH
jgi:hypothetical protein